MKRIPASQKIRKELEELLNNGVDSKEFLLSEIIRKGAALIIQELEVLEKLAVEMYARGLSTRDIEDALIEATGDMILSKTAVSNVTEILYKEFEEFQNRDLSGFEIEYLF